MLNKNYVGYLCVSNPSNPRDSMSRTIMMIVTHTENSTVGVQINIPYEDLTLSKVSENIGIDHDGDQPIFLGGDTNTNKIHVIHSLDWQGMTTVQLTDNIGITNDISVLLALSKNQGPEFFRACAGYRIWRNGLFDIQIDPTSTSQQNPDGHKWELLPATIDNTFLLDPYQQWQACLEESAKYAVNLYFDD